MINKRLRAVSCFLCALLAAASFSGCTKQGDQGNADGTGTDKVINDGKPVTIIVSLGEYEPTTMKYRLKMHRPFLILPES